MQTYGINKLETIVIGVEQDNIAHQVGIDMTDWLTENDRYTNFRVEVVNPDGYIYIAGNTELVGNVLVWTITDSDTTLPGKGKYQIVGMGEDGLRRTSYTAEIRIMRKIPGTASEETPDPAKPWTDKAQESALIAQEASISAENHMLEAQAAQEAAEAARDEAESHIATIKGYADDAAEAAGNADTSAKEAAGYAATIAQARDESVSARNEAVNAALQAESAEIRARQQAESAREEADRAAAAQTAAETAKDGAETAQEAAEAAQKRAEDAVDEIRTMTAEAVTLPPESEATAHYDSDSGKMTFGIPQGKNGKDGTDADVTADNIANALGYTPADAAEQSRIFESITDIQRDKADKSEIPNVPVKSVSAGGSALTPDESGNVDIPWAGSTNLGLVRINSTYGLYMNSNNHDVRLGQASDDNIDTRSQYRAIVPSNLDYAVKAALADGKGAAYTAEEQAAARQRIGVDECELISNLTLDEDAHEISVDLNGKFCELYIDYKASANTGHIYSVIDLYYGSQVYEVITTPRYFGGGLPQGCFYCRLHDVVGEFVKAGRNASYYSTQYPVFTFLQIEKPYVTRFKIKSDSAAFIAGTTFTIYGRRFA